MLHERRSVLGIAAFGLLCAWMARGAEIVLPDPAKGEINGRRAVLFWPSLMPTTKSGEGALLPPDGCEVHLVPHADLDRELRYPCGRWFQPAAGGYNVWLEQADRISVSPKVMWFTDVAFKGRGMTAVDILLDAGRVAFPAGSTIASTEAVRLVSIDSHLRLGGRGRIFDRRLSAADLHAPVRMPAGKVIVGRFDRATGQALALSRPFSVSAGAVATAWPKPPATGSDLLVVVEKPSSARSGAIEAKPVQLEIDDGANHRAPDVLIDGFERLIAIWYSIDARAATLSLRATSFFLAPQELKLRAGTVSTLRLSGQALPGAHVSILTPEGSLPKESTLTVMRESDRVVERQMSVAVGVVDLPNLPAERLRLRLDVGRWHFDRIVDLSSGADANAAFELNPLSIHGRVFWGDDPIPAEIAFRNGDDWVKSDADTEGYYETLLWYGGQYTVTVQTKGTKAPPFLEAFKTIETSGTVDFRLPRTDVRMHAIDEGTGLPIEGAIAMISNVWINENGREETIAQRATSGPDGEIVFPPLRPGDVHVELRAKGYENSEPLDFRSEKKESRRFDVALRSIHASARLRVVLADGRPAAGADVWAFAIEPGLRLVWQGSTNEQGGVELPERTRRGRLLIRHREAASTIRESPPADAEWTLDSPAAPLVIEAKKVSEGKAGSMRMALWLDGVKLTGVPLAFATWGAVAADARGFWIARNLPSRPVRVLACARGELLDQAAFDALATNVSYPWPGAVLLQAAE